MSVRSARDDAEVRGRLGAEFTVSYSVSKIFLSGITIKTIAQDQLHYEITPYTTEVSVSN